MQRIIRQYVDTPPRDLDDSTVAERKAGAEDVARMLSGEVPGEIFVVDLARPLVDDGGLEQAEGFIAFLEEQERAPCPCPICMEFLRAVRR